MMNEPGRPTLYRPDLCELARNYCLLGATNEDLGVFFDVTSRTIDNWIAAHPEFATAVREAKALADARVARCLYQRAVGHEHKIERTTWHLGKQRTFEDRLYYPPDVRACIFWLRNRQPQYWRGRAWAPEDDRDDLIAALDAAGERAGRAGSTGETTVTDWSSAKPDDGNQG
jgi:hypothetical protein